MKVGNITSIKIEFTKNVPSNYTKKQILSSVVINCFHFFIDIEDFAVNDMTPESLSTSAFPEPDHENDIEPSDELEDLTFSESYSSENGVVMWTITFLLQLQVIHGISDRALDSILLFLKTTLKVLSNAEKGLSIQRFMQVFPGTL